MAGRTRCCWERDELTSGSSWHAAGQIHTISSDPNISRLQGYTISLYDEIEELSGQSVGLHRTGGFYLASNEAWHDYLKRGTLQGRAAWVSTRSSSSVEEAARRHPLIDPSRYIAGTVGSSRRRHRSLGAVTWAYARAARALGADYMTAHPRFWRTVPRPDGSWDVITGKGTIRAEHVVNAAGLWAREVGRLAGLHLPVQPMEHHYLVTEDIPEIVAREERLPAGIDYEGKHVLSPGTQRHAARHL